MAVGGGVSSVPVRVVGALRGKPIDAAFSGPEGGSARGWRERAGGAKLEGGLREVVVAFHQLAYAWLKRGASIDTGGMLRVDNSSEDSIGCRLSRSGCGSKQVGSARSSPRVKVTRGRSLWGLIGLRRGTQQEAKRIKCTQERQTRAAEVRRSGPRTLRSVKVS